MQNPFRRLGATAVASVAAVSLSAGTAQAYTWGSPVGTFTTQAYQGQVPSGATETVGSFEYQAPCSTAPYCPVTVDAEQDVWTTSTGVETFTYGTTGSPLPFHRLQFGYQPPNSFSYSWN
jgi:hypothetical protein